MLEVLIVFGILAPIAAIFLVYWNSEKGLHGEKKKLQRDIARLQGFLSIAERSSVHYGVDSEVRCCISPTGMCCRFFPLGPLPAKVKSLLPREIVLSSIERIRMMDEDRQEDVTEVVFSFDGILGLACSPNVVLFGKHISQEWDLGKDG